MLGDQEKSFFIQTALRSAELSGCVCKQGSVLVQDRKILSYGFNKRVLKGINHEISAIYDTIFGSRTENLVNSTLFCSYFPSVNDLTLMVSVGVTSVYFTGDIKDPEAVHFMNKLHEEDIPLLVIKMK